MLWDDIIIGYIKGIVNLYVGRKEFDYIYMIGFVYLSCFNYKFIILILMIIYCFKWLLDMID